jgi:hypothetical protein
MTKFRVHEKIGSFGCCCLVCSWEREMRGSLVADFLKWERMSLVVISLACKVRCGSIVETWLIAWVRWKLKIKSSVWVTRGRETWVYAFN